MPLAPPDYTLFRRTSHIDAFTISESDAEGRSWWTVYTRSGQEKPLALELNARRIPFYLPLAQRETNIRSRSLSSHLPLFSNYIFLFCNEDECLSVLATRLVSRILPVDDEQRLRRNLQRVQQLVESDISLTVETRVPKGAEVRIRSGSLSSIEGVLMDRSGEHRLFVAIEEIGQGVSIPIDNLLFEPARYVATKR